MGLSFFPGQASTEAPHTDFIYFILIGFSLVVTSIVVGLLVVFAMRYRRGSEAKRGELPEWFERDFEIGWTSATFFLFLFVAFWTGATRISALTPPATAMEIHVVAKQWMWKTQHANGAREINALHVPVDEPVRLAMTSEDVIHSFFAPGVSRQAGRAAGPLHPGLVQRDQDRRLPPAVHSALRDRACAHGWRNHRDVPRRLRPMARKSAARRRHRQGRSGLVRLARLLGLPRGRLQDAGASA